MNKFIQLWIAVAISLIAIVNVSSWISGPVEKASLIINGQLVQPATTYSGNVDMNNNIISNIGNAATDFTAGGLTAPYLTATTAISDAGSLNVAGAIVGSQGITNTGGAVSIKGADATANLTILPNGTATLQSGSASNGAYLQHGTASYIQAGAGTVNIKGDLVNPETTCNGAVCINDNTVVTGTLTATGSIQSLDTVRGTVDLSGGAIRNTDANCNGAVCINDNTVVTGTLTATVAATAPYITATVGISNPNVRTGGAVMPSGGATASVIFTHSLGITPTRVFMSPTSDPTDAGSFSAAYWINTCNPTNCTASAKDAMGVSQFTFDWRATVGENQ
jgi:hypothetical protein